MPEADFAQLWINDVQAPLRVVSFHGVERLSRPHRFDIRALTRRVPSVGGASPTGRRAVLTFQPAHGADTPPRVVRGVLTRWQVEGHPVHNDHFVVRARLMAPLALLRHRTDSRIFQDLSVVEVLKAVLERYRIPLVEQLQGTYPKLDYCVQYAETDLAFVHRLLAEHGLFYWIEPAGALAAAATSLLEGALGEGTLFAGATLGAGALPEELLAVSQRDDAVVLCDRAALYPALGTSLDVDALLGGAVDAAVSVAAARPLRFAGQHDGAVRTEDTVHGFALRNAVRAHAAEQRGYDFTEPLVPQVATASASADADAALTEAVAAEPLEHYHHHDEYGRPRVNRRGARLALARTRADALHGEGRSAVADLAPGRRFVLEAHPLEELNREYALAWVEHTGQTPEFGTESATEPPAPYANRFGCVPSDVPLLPPYTPRRPQQTLESAVVVGAAGEDVYTDEHGRVKVQFHWDRHGARDARSSCWLRVAQAWGGAGRGAQFIPRVGDEVLVAFLEGDTDRPVVIGSLYNGSLPAPFKLPEDKTRSGLRTRSTPGGEGFNELSFEDSAGHEQVLLHAQRDLIERVENNHELRVGLAPAPLGGNQTVSVSNDREVAVGGEARWSVQGNAARSVGRSASDVVLGDYALSARGDVVQTVGGALRTDVAGDAYVDVAGALVTRAELQTTRVAGDQTTTVLGGQSTRVVGAEGSTLRVEASGAISCGDGLVLDAGKGLRLICGESVIDLRPSEIVLQSPKLVLLGGDVITQRVDSAAIELKSGAAVVRAGTVSLQGDGATLKLADHVAAMRGDDAKVLGSGASLVLNSTATLQGAKVSLTSGGSEDLAQSPSPGEYATEWLDIHLVDADDHPRPGVTYVVETARGDRYTGVLNKDGKARVLVDPGTCRVWFPQMERAFWEKE